MTYPRGGTPQGKVNLSDPDFAQRQDHRTAGSTGTAAGRDQQQPHRHRRRRRRRRLTRLQPPRANGRRRPAQTRSHRHQAGPGVVLADASSRRHDRMETIINRGILLLLPPGAGKRKTAGPAGAAVSMPHRGHLSLGDSSEPRPAHTAQTTQSRLTATASPERKSEGRPLAALRTFCFGAACQETSSLTAVKAPSAVLLSSASWTIAPAAKASAEQVGSSSPLFVAVASGDAGASLVRLTASAPPAP